MKTVKSLMIFFRNRILGEVSTKKLVKRGLKIGKGFSIQAKCMIDSSHCWLIQIGDNVTLAPGVHVLAHDASTKRSLGYTKIGLVRIGNNVFVGAHSVILPGVTIGDNAIIGAGSIVSRDVPENSVVAGNPSKIICRSDEYLTRHREKLLTSPVFDKRYTIAGGISSEMKSEMIERLEEGIGYVE